MLKPGDYVYVEKSAFNDLGYQARLFVQRHPRAQVKMRMAFVNDTGDVVDTPEQEMLYAVQWDEEFPGGHDCQGTCEPRKGQFITSKHLSLIFEESREVNTVPNLQGDNETGTTKNK